LLADAPGQAKLPPSSLRAPWGAPVGEDVDPNVTFETSSDENAPAAIIFTSGTEGRAKAVVLSHRSLIAVNKCAARHTTAAAHPECGLRRVTLHRAALHIGGIGAPFGASCSAIRCFLTGRFDPGEAHPIYRALSHHPLERRAHHGDPADRPP
jgi:acyl-CoA synthetase (AMP-forming)/AMP-acid ligase II